MAKPEQVEVREQTGSIHLLGGVVNFFREWRESKQIEKHSRRYVDAIFDCYINGVLTGSQLNESLKHDDEKFSRLGLSGYAVRNHAFHRTIMLHLEGYLPLESREL